MSLTAAQAAEIAERELLTHSTEVASRILPERIEEFDCGWLYYYQSARYLETGKFEDSLVGNAPIFVARSDGKAFFVSYLRPIVESLAAYRSCGNPNALQLAEVRLTGWLAGAQVVSAIQAIRRHSSLGLAEVKGIVENCLASQPSVVAVSTVEEAKALVAVLAPLGFQSEVGYDG
jgi:hypothetical protein